MSLTFEEHQTLDQVCSRLLQNPHVRFCGIINHLGRLVVGNFKKGTVPLEKEHKMQMMFMQLVLETNMRKEYDDTLGKLEYTISKRDKVLIITIPIRDDQLIVMSVMPTSDIQTIVKNTMQEFNYSRMIPINV